MYELAKVGGYLLSPLTLAFLFWLVALVCIALRYWAWAVGLAFAAGFGLWFAATPLIAELLAGALESQYPVTAAAATPHADAVVILGGALATSGSAQINMGGAADRIWHAAALYREGKAKWVIVAAGGKAVVGANQVEADAIGEMLVILGVPQTAIRPERVSRNTRENALFVRPILDQLQVRRVLLVTSAVHMPRTLKTFRQTWAEIDWIPATTDMDAPSRDFSLMEGILPSASALNRTTRAIKEYAGLIAL